MEESVFRKKSLDRISSPEQLDDYLHVTSPSVWVVMAAVLILLAGMIVWGAVTTLESYAAGTGTVKEKEMAIYFDDESLAENVEAGMKVVVGSLTTKITSVGYDSDGRFFATAAADMADGTYSVRVSYKQTQVLKLLFR